MAARIVIAGGGFGGLYAARTLERVLPRDRADITLLSDLNYLLFAPLLPGAAGGTLEPRHVVVPLREQLKRAKLLVGRVTGARPEDRRVLVTTIDGRDVELPYDHLIVAVGSVSRTLPIPGLAEHAIGFKTIAEGIALRNRLIHHLEVAEALEDPEERGEFLTFVFVGAGYAGLEGLAELQDFAGDVLELYPKCRAHGMRWVQVEARERIMLEVSERLAGYVARALTKRGIEVQCDTTVEEITARDVRLSTGEVIPTRTVVWTAGVKAHPVVARMGLPLGAQGRIRVDSHMRVEGHDDIWAIGDAAAVPDPARPGEICPPTAQHALRQGRRVARNVAAALGKGRSKPFGYKTLGAFVDLGRYKAVAMTMGIRWRGLPAWFLARTYHVLAMPGIGRRMRLIADWTVALFFRRAAPELGQLGHPPALGDAGAHDEAARLEALS